jgi:hypothetical protein
VQVPYSDRSTEGDSADLRPHGSEAAVMCDDGYRAMTSDDTVTIAVPCHEARHFNASCGVGTLGHPAYSPCSWTSDMKCRRVTCEVAPLADGTQTVSTGSIANISGVHYMVRMPCTMMRDRTMLIASIASRIVRPDRCCGQRHCCVSTSYASCFD